MARYYVCLFLQFYCATMQVTSSCFSHEEAFRAFCSIRRPIYFMSFKHLFAPFSILMPEICWFFIISGAIRTRKFLDAAKKRHLDAPETISVGIRLWKSSKISIMNSFHANKNQSHNLHGIYSANLGDSKFGLEFILLKSTKQIMAQGYYCSPNSLLFNLNRTLRLWHDSDMLPILLLRTQLFWCTERFQ